jgi:hypothetical protein
MDSNDEWIIYKRVWLVKQNSKIAITRHACWEARWDMREGLWLAIFS